MRVTAKILESLVDSINKVAGTPISPFTDGKWNIDNYHIYHAYNSVSLHKVSNDGGGVTQIYGPCSNRELYCFMQGYIQGIFDCKKLHQLMNKIRCETSNRYIT